MIMNGLLNLPEGIVARRVAGGRKGATRWELYCTDGSTFAPSDLDDFAWQDIHILGEIVRWMPEGVWSWQPACTFEAIAASTPLPPSSDDLATPEQAVAMAAAAAVTR